MKCLSSLGCATAVFLMVGCNQPVQPPSGPRITGSLLHLERIALPPDSTMIVELRSGQAPNDMLVASYSEALEGRQVPFAFELEIPAESAESQDPLQFRGGVHTSAGDLWLTESVPVEMTGRSVLDLGELRLRRSAQVEFGTPFRCGRHTVAFGALGRHPRLIVDGKVFDMARERSASGARFRSLDDSETEFWNKGAQAMVTVRGERLPECRRIEAPETPFTARGQEPGWQLRITDEAIELERNYGTQQSTFPYVEPSVAADGVARYRTSNGDSDLEIVVEPAICRDSMSGMPHPATVGYMLDGEAARGCGGEPEDLLLGDEWRVVSIDGEAVLEDAVPTIEFLAEDNRVAGLASCNRFTGSFELTGEGLRFGQFAVTTRACIDPAAQEQEDRFVELLQKTARFEMAGFNRLRLVTSDNETIEATR
ncbi:MAG: META domain-containing protein [Wenzhouxiangellaceae bacterium]